MEELGPAAPTVLYASYVSPFPPHSGERIRALNLIRALRDLGYRVEAIVGDYDGVEIATLSGGGLRFQKIPFAWPRLRQAASTYFRPNARFVEQVRALHQARPLAAIVLDYGFMGAQIAPLSRLGVPVILGTHNLESAVTGQIQRSSIGADAAIRLRRAIEFAHERFYFRAADAVLCVSEEDRRAYARFVPENRLHLVPNFVDLPDAFADTPRENRIIMTGSFGNFQNLDGLRWFVREVWNSELWSRTTLCVAGRLSRETMREFAGVPAIEAFGERADLIGEIARSRCAVVPVHHGGGTRLKCIEAMAARTPVVTTAKGCEGIAHGGAFRVAETPSAFRAAIRDVLDNPEAAKTSAASARAMFDREYGLAANTLRLERALHAAARAHECRLGLPLGRLAPG